MDLTLPKMDNISNNLVTNNVIENSLNVNIDDLNINDIIKNYENMKKYIIMINTKCYNLTETCNNLNKRCDELAINNRQTINTHITNGSSIMSSVSVILNEKSRSKKLFYFCWAMFMYNKYLYTVVHEIRNNPLVQILLQMIELRFGLSFDKLYKYYMKIRRKFTDFYDFLNKCYNIMVKMCLAKNNNSYI